MKTHKPDDLALLWRTYPLHGGNRLSIAMLALFDLDRSGDATPRPESDLWAAFDAVAPGLTADWGFAKGCGEFLVFGAACAPRGKTERQLAAAVRIGTIGKTLYVFGDRTFGPLGGISAPTPFSRMPIGPGNAFGGPSFAANPQGKGASDIPGGPRPLPNVEWPGRLIAFAGDTPPPAGFGPLRADAPERLRHLGAFDASWLSRQWPHLPADTAPDYFQDAPADQRIAGFWRGDEDIEIRNMHPDHAVLRARLPGLRARCIVRRLIGGKTVMEEVPARAETVWLLPERGQGIVLYRAVAPIDDEDALDVQSLHAAWERMSEPPRPAADFAEPLEPRQAEAPIPTPSTPPPPSATAVAAATAAMAAGASVPGAHATSATDFAELEAMVAQLEAQGLAQRQQHGLTADDVQRLMPQPAASATSAPSLEELEAMVGELETRTQAQALAFGLKPEDLAAPQPAPFNDAATADTTLTLDQWAADVQAAQALREDIGVPPEDLRAWIDNRPELAPLAKEIGHPIDTAGLFRALDALDGTMASTAAAAATQAAPAPAPDAPPKAEPAPPAVHWTRERVLASHAAGHPLSDLDLKGLDLSGLDLAGADFSRSTLEAACFDGARLASARFEDALLQDASFRNVDAAGAVFRRAHAARSVFSHAAAVGAIFDAADFSLSDFDDATLRNASLIRTDFSRSRMNRLDASDATGEQADFTGCGLDGALFQAARLPRARFNDASATAPDFSLVQGERSEWYGAQMPGVRFVRANLAGARAGRGTRFDQAVLHGTRLDHAGWEGCDLRGADLQGATLRSADFSGIQGQGLRMPGADARHCNLSLAHLNDADCRGANLMSASLRRARLEGCSLDLGNLHGSDLQGSNIGRARTQGALLTATLLAIPGRPESRSKGASA